MFETAETGAKISKEQYRAMTPDLRVRLLNGQFDLRKTDRSILVLLVGDDRWGVDQTLRTLNEWMDARYVASEAFPRPTDVERERPRFWRYWLRLPAAGRLGIFLGAWPLNTISRRVRGEIDDDAFERLMRHETRFERGLVDNGTTVLKFWLHLPQEQFKKRLKRASSEDSLLPHPGETDWAVLEHYDEVMALATRYLSITDATNAPWRIVESTNARYRDVTIAESIARAIDGAVANADDGKQAHDTNHAVDDAIDTARPHILDQVNLSKTIDYEDYKSRMHALQLRLGDLVRQARETGVTTVLAFEGWDAAGKGGVIRRITGALSPRDYRVIPIGAPTEEERDHHYLWRFWRHLPRAGRVCIFDRSWYGRVLVERVEALASPDVWRRAYKEINEFEWELCDHGVVLEKFWLHIDADEQMRRFKAREQTPYKKYKITQEDYRNRERWNDYVHAVDDMVSRTSTDTAPWRLVAANDKRSARVTVLEHVVGALAAKLDGSAKT